jgi:hypothetical protein
MEDLLRATSLTIIYNQDLPEPLRPTMAEIPTIFTNEYYRSFLVARVADPFVRNFWESSYNPLTPYQQWDLHRSSMNKVRRFLLNPTIRNIVGQGTSSLNLRQAMDERKILLFNLSKGMLGEDNGALLGSVLVGKILISLLSRTDQERSTREPFHLFVDEFHNYATTSFETLQTEARKFGADIFVFHQFRDQMEERRLKMSALSVGTVIVFRVNSHDAAELAWVFDTSPPPGEPKLEMVTEPATETYKAVVWTPQEAEVEYKEVCSQLFRPIIEATLLAYGFGFCSVHKGIKELLELFQRGDEKEITEYIYWTLNPNHRLPEVQDYGRQKLNYPYENDSRHSFYGEADYQANFGGKQAISFPATFLSVAEERLSYIAHHATRQDFYIWGLPRDVSKPDEQTIKTIAASLLAELQDVFIPLKQRAGSYEYDCRHDNHYYHFLEANSYPQRWKVKPFPEMLPWLTTKVENLCKLVEDLKQRHQQLWNCRKEEKRTRYLGYELPVKSVKPDPFRKDYGEEYTQYAWKEGPTKLHTEVAAEIANTLTNLPPFTARCKLGTSSSLNGQSTDYTITTLEPPKHPDGAGSRIPWLRQQSQQTYGRDRATVEQEISERVSRSLAWAKPGSQPITKQPTEPRSRFRPQPPAARPPESAADDDQPIQPRRKTS